MPLLSERPEIRRDVPLPAIGSRVTLWTRGEPPLFVGMFTMTDPELPELYGRQTDVALVGIDHEYVTEYLRRNRGYGGCEFVLSSLLSDKYDPDTIFPTIYGVVNIGVESYIAKLSDEVAHPLLVLLREAGQIPAWYEKWRGECNEQDSTLQR